MRQENINIIPLQAAATITSAPIKALNLFAASAQITCVGGGSGTLVMNASNDDPQSAPFLPVNFSAIPNAAVTVTGDGSFLIPKIDLCYQWVQLVYTNTGAGTISVVFKALGE